MTDHQYCEDEASSSSSDETNDNENDHHPPLDLETKLVLRVHVSNLPRNGIRKILPDTYVEVTVIYAPSEERSEESSTAADMNSMSALRRVNCGRTEIIYKSTSPQYTTTFPLTYEYGSKSYLSIDVYRFSNNGNREPLRIGSAVCDIGDVLGSKQRTKIKRLPSGGVIFCRLENPTPEPEPSSELATAETATAAAAAGAVSRSLTSRASHTETLPVSGRLRIQVRARDLIFGKRHRTPGAVLGLHNPDTIFAIEKRHPNASHQAWVTVYRSSPVYEARAPTFDAGEIDIFALCNGDLERPIRLGVWCHKKWGKDRLVGICETTPKVLLDGKYALDHPHECPNDVHHSFRLCRSMNKTKNVGIIDIISARLVDNDSVGDGGMISRNVQNSYSNNQPPEQYPAQHPHSEPRTMFAAGEPSSTTSFQEFMKSGYCKLVLSVAIDFTSSNGDPRSPGTLHDQSSENLNDYEETIVAVGGLLMPHSESVSIHGFGAKYGGTTRHLFHCGDAAATTPVENTNNDVGDILRAYKSVFASDLTMSGPTMYDKVLQAAAVRAKNCQSRHQSQLSPSTSSSFPYCVLLIITDGLSQDMGEIKRKLQIYSSVPLSVVIVGVGRVDFGDMHRLCHEISQSGNRPNLSFVEFRRHQHDPFSLGAAALHGIPTQILRYMGQHGIQPP
ncbi:MAG: hypothetical protein SGILL_008380 [Bacillariaceae sp.]